MSPRARVAAALVVPVLLLGYQLQLWSHAMGIGIDDSYIGYIYARNLVEQGELNWVPGGVRVEGYTDFLWILLMAVPHLLGMHMPHFFKAVGALSALGTLWLVARMEEGAEPACRRIPWISPLLVATSANVPLYAMSGIETDLFLVMVALGAALHLQERPVASAALFGLSALTRPEGAVFFALSVGHRVLERAPLREIVSRSLVFGAIVGPHALFRKLYYGLWLPHSFHVKAGGMDRLTQWKNGLAMLQKFYVADDHGRPGPGTMLLVLAISALVVHRAWPRAKVYFLLNVAVHAVYVASVGFDFMAKHRHQVMVLPFLAGLAALGIRGWQDLAARLHPRAGPAVALFLAALCVGRQWDTDTTETRFHVTAGLGDLDVRLEIGRHLARVTPPGTFIASGECGKIPYFARRPSMDLSGINDPEIGKRRPYAEIKPAPLPKDVILRRRPGVVIIPSFQLGLSPRRIRDVTELSRVPTLVEPDFLALYEMREERVAGLWFYSFRLREAE